MKIHIGCGEKIIKGFVNVDVRNLPGVDVICDITDISSFGKDSAELIYASHVLEHIGRKEYKEVLKNWFLTLKKGGVLRLAVPDLEKVFHHYSHHKDLKQLLGFLYGGQTYPENFHYCGWDFQTLSQDLYEIGFEKVERYDWRKTEHSHIDDFSQCYLPHMDKENGILMSLNIEATK